MTGEVRPRVRQRSESGLLPLSTGLLFFIPVALLGSVVSVLLRYPQLGSAVLFPPYAALTAVLVASARRNWGWYILVAAVAHMIASVSHWPLWWVLTADVGNTLRALVAAILLRRLFGGPPRLDSILGLLQFVVSAVIVGPAVGATIGAIAPVLSGTSQTYWGPWTGWFVSNALTALTMMPGFVVALRDWDAWRRSRIDPRRVVEALVLAVALGVTCLAASLVHSTSQRDLTLLLYAPLPLLIWAALRFGEGGASVALTAVAAATVWGADRGGGPFVSPSIDEKVLSIQVFMVLAALPVLCIAAIGSARQGAVQLYHAVLASLQDHVAILDAHGIVLEVNHSWQQYADAGHECPLDRARAGDDYVAACRAAIEQRPPAPGADEDVPAARALAGVESVLRGERRRFEMEYDQHRDGRQEWYTIRVEALERIDGGLVVTRSDVSARHRAQNEIELQRRELSHLARVGVLGQFSGALAHELRQPLASILSNAEAGRHLLQRAPVDFDELNAILHDIASEDRRAAQVINGLRSMLKRGETRTQPVDTGALVSEVLALAHAELATRRVTAVATVDSDLPPLLADRVQVQQVLLNLILNACEAMSSTPAADRSLVLTASPSGKSHVHFAIRDCGTGIAPALIDRLFEPFVTTRPDGLGLGLSIARSIVSAHGGRIWAENNAGRGATVHCVFASAAMDEVTQTAPLADAWQS